jgi:hypothetical protein
VVSKELFKSATTVVMLVVILAAAVYYFVPDNVESSSIAFALGASSQMNGREIASHETGIRLNVTFSNGSCATIFQSEANCDTYIGEVNAKDLKFIDVTLAGVTYVSHNDYNKIIIRSVENKTVDSVLTAGETTNLGTAKVIGWPDGFTSLKSNENLNEPGNWSDLPINATIYENGDLNSGTGHWKNSYEWRLDMEELQNVAHKGSSQINVTFNLDYNVILRYMVTNEGESIYGDANLQWSGKWGTLQFTYNEHGLTSLKFSFVAVKLAAFAA